jgi:hypothetical protein
VLLARSATPYGFRPGPLSVRDCNHFSQAVAQNIGDENLAGPVTDFVWRHA